MLTMDRYSLEHLRENFERAWKKIAVLLVIWMLQNDKHFPHDYNVIYDIAHK